MSPLCISTNIAGNYKPGRPRRNYGCNKVPGTGCEVFGYQMITPCLALLPVAWDTHEGLMTNGRFVSTEFAARYPARYTNLQSETDKVMKLCLETWTFQQ